MNRKDFTKMADDVWNCVEKAKQEYPGLLDSVSKEQFYVIAGIFSGALETRESDHKTPDHNEKLQPLPIDPELLQQLEPED